MPEISDTLLSRVVFYSSLLAVPSRRNSADPTVREGEKIFYQIGCTACHTPRFVTGQHLDIPELSNQTIRPFTDLLLHDMGAELADDRPDYQASGSEWRTPPLWGIGLFQRVSGHTRYLHDGRARNLEEALLWHGGEAASTRDRYKALTKEDREALILFLNSL
jgi:CxxC motif-containing protein (DUF1111 family)